MVKPKGLFVLLSIYSALLATYGHKIGITLVVCAASATTSIKNVKATSTTTTKSSSCDVNSNEPDCIADNNNNNSNGNDNHKKNNVQQQRSTKDVPRKDKQSNSHSHSQQQQHNNNNHNPRPKFKTGDIIELYNTDSRDIQIVFPSIVKKRDNTNTGTTTYRVTKTTDGKEVTNLPEKYLHLYIPYDIGSLALCNVGSFSNKANENRPIIVQCTVEDYMPAAKRGAMVLQGKYSVLVHETNVNGKLFF